MDENKEKCEMCEFTYCLDLKTGICEDNVVIENEEKKYYFMCSRTNKNGTRNF